MVCLQSYVALQNDRDIQDGMWASDDNMLGKVWVKRIFDQ